MNDPNEKTSLPTEHCADIRQAQLPNERAIEESPRREVTGLRFDWQPLSLSAPSLVCFDVEIHCQDERARVQFGLDLSLLKNAELAELHHILSMRHAGLDTRETLLGSIQWMLSISLGQVEPNLTETERQLKARRLLLLPTSGELKFP